MVRLSRRECAAAALTLPILQGAHVTPLAHAHAHNDYEHPRPLLDALSFGFTNVEADIYLLDGELRVAHELRDTKPGRTLQSLYLDPLADRIRTNGEHVLAKNDGFTLLVDVKTEAKETFAALRKALTPYQPLLSRQGDGKPQRGAITVVVSGNRDTDAITGDPDGLCGLDGRLADLGKTQWTPRQMPWISDRWGAHFTWNGTGDFPQDQRERLVKTVQRVHAEGRKLRFWATPETDSAWGALRSAGVDLIGTDDLARLSGFLLVCPQRGRHFKMSPCDVQNRLPLGCGSPMTSVAVARCSSVGTPPASTVRLSGCETPPRPTVRLEAER